MKNILIAFILNAVLFTFANAQAPAAQPATVPTPKPYSPTTAKPAEKVAEKSPEKKEKAKKRRKDFAKECRQTPEVVSAMKACIKAKNDTWKTAKANKKGTGPTMTSTPAAAEPSN
jgi:hypothetical protein